MAERKTAIVIVFERTFIRVLASSLLLGGSVVLSLGNVQVLLGQPRREHLLSWRSELRLARVSLDVDHWNCVLFF